jgi:hypothetical protein
MKKILIVLLVIVSGLVVNAQGVFSLGPKIGYNSNKLSDNFDSINAGIKNSFQIGAFVRIGSKVYFQPEVNYQIMRGNLNKSSGSSFQNQDLTIKSIKVPALIGIKLVNKSVVNLRVMAGPTVTFLFNKKLDPSNMGELWPIQSVDDLKNSIWSVQLGAGLDVLFMTLDVRYEFGVDNMYNGSSDLKMRNNIFNVSLGVKLL